VDELAGDELKNRSPCRAPFRLTPSSQDSATHPTPKIAPVTLSPLPAFTDNYIWCWHDERRALAVDPGEAEPLLRHLEAQALQLEAVLITHHHPDHIGGLPALAARWPGLRVIGPADARIDGLSEIVGAGDAVEVNGERLRVLEVPGHTRHHIAFVIDRPRDGGPPLLFCGDTLFAAGCGRLFEGTPAQMLDSLKQFAALPPATRVCCTHEYTLANLRFALAVDPHNRALQARQIEAAATRAAGQPTLPSSIALELATNPFLRAHEPALREAARYAPEPAADGSELAVFTALRAWKNVF
jgi:hydroxyacylglutathione hydrolase